MKVFRSLIFQVNNILKPIKWGRKKTTYYLLKIWRNVYFIEKFDETGRKTSAKKRHSEYKFYVNEVRKWVNKLPAWFSDNSKNLIENIIEEELIERRTSLKILWFITDKVNFGSLGLDLVKKSHREELAINSGIYITYKMPKKDKSNKIYNRVIPRIT